MVIKLGIIGGGNMGEAIIANSLKSFKIAVSERDEKRQRYLQKKYRLISQSISTLSLQSDMVILAMKPQDMDGVLDEFKGYLAKDKLVISIAAGITTKYIERRLGKSPRVIRTMPNMPALVAKGVTAICQGKYASIADVKSTQNIFNNLGQTVVVKENLLDAITAVSGSGPAYVFLFMECLTKAARSLGLNEALAKELVIETFNGSVHLLKEKKFDPTVLRAKVTSKGGTTQAAMDVFTQNKLEQIIQKALRAAKQRAKELSKG